MLICFHKIFLLLLISKGSKPRPEARNQARVNSKGSELHYHMMLWRKGRNTFYNFEATWLILSLKKADYLSLVKFNLWSEKIYVYLRTAIHYGKKVDVFSLNIGKCDFSWNLGNPIGLKVITILGLIICCHKPIAVAEIETISKQ